MIERREFLRSLIGLSLLLTFPEGATICHSAPPTKKPPFAADPTGERTIYCLIGDRLLAGRLKQCAKEIGCRIFFEDPFSPELLFMPHFVSVLDRNLIGDELWDIYADWCDEVKISASCLIVDNINHLRLPTNNLVTIFDPYDSSNEDIIHLIKALHKRRNIRQFLVKRKTTNIYSADYA